MSAFMDLPDQQRFELRCELEAAGSCCQSYESDGFTLAIQRGKFAEVNAAAARLGLSLAPGSLNYFPLGTSQVSDEFRHWCPPYTAERGYAPGFWLFATFRLA